MAVRLSNKTRKIMSLVPPSCENASDAEYFSDEFGRRSRPRRIQSSVFSDIDDDNLLNDETAQYEICNTNHSVVTKKKISHKLNKSVKMSSDR